MINITCKIQHLIDTLSTITVIKCILNMHELQALRARQRNPPVAKLVAQPAARTPTELLSASSANIVNYLPI